MQPFATICLHRRSVGLLRHAYRNKMRKSLQSAVIRVIVSLVLLREYQGAAQNGRRLAYTTRKGVELCVLHYISDGSP